MKKFYKYMVFILNIELDLKVFKKSNKNINYPSHLMGTNLLVFIILLVFLLFFSFEGIFFENICYCYDGSRPTLQNPEILEFWQEITQPIQEENMPAFLINNETLPMFLVDATVMTGNILADNFRFSLINQHIGYYNFGNKHILNVLMNPDVFLNTLQLCEISTEAVNHAFLISNLSVDFYNSFVPVYEILNNTSLPRDDSLSSSLTLLKTCIDDFNSLLTTSKTMLSYRSGNISPNPCDLLLYQELEKNMLIIDQSINYINIVSNNIENNFILNQ